MNGEKRTDHLSTTVARVHVARVHGGLELVLSGLERAELHPAGVRNRRPTGFTHHHRFPRTGRCSHGDRDIPVCLTYTDCGFSISLTLSRLPDGGPGPLKRTGDSS